MTCRQSSHLPYIMPTTASEVLGAFVPRDATGLHPLYPVNERQRALAEYLAECARQRWVRERRQGRVN